MKELKKQRKKRKMVMLMKTQPLRETILSDVPHAFYQNFLMTTTQN